MKNVKINASVYRMSDSDYIILKSGKFNNFDVTNIINKSRWIDWPVQIDYTLEIEHETT